MSSGGYGDANPHATVVYDGTPLGRVRSEYGPGEAWQTAGKKTDYRYIFNTADDSDTGVLSYTVNITGLYNINVTINKGGWHPANTLTIVETTDEDGRRMMTFTDMYGKTVLERRFLQDVNGDNIKVDTYYCYDGAGRLTGVLPPMLTQYLDSEQGTSFSLSSVPDIGHYAYFYRYDNRGRIIGKHLPGSGWTYYVYDGGDRLIFSQDPNQRENDRWSFSIPDRLGRVCLVGECSGLINAFNGFLGNGLVTAVRSYPSLSTAAQYYGYDIDAPDNLLISIEEIYSVSWYGDYSFLGKWGIPASDSPGTKFEEGAPSLGYGEQYESSCHGLLTGRLERILGENETGKNDYLWSVLYYDDKGTVVQSSRSRLSGTGWDRTNTGYDFVGNPSVLRTVHYDGNRVIAERYSYTYDSWSRPLTVSHELGQPQSLQSGEYAYQASGLLHDYSYDFAGRLSGDGRNGNAVLRTRYSYNVRSALDTIVTGADSGGYGSAFREVLRYNIHDSSGNNVQEWGGNISSIDWQAGGDGVTHSYVFSYDGLSRLKGAYYGSDNGTENFDRSYEYDLNGNITKLTATEGITAPLYEGNRPVGLGPSDISFEYDANGNLIKDLQRGLQNGTYNVINLPKSFDIGNGSLTSESVSYQYGAGGEKLREKHVGGSPSLTVRDYVDGNLIYTDGVLGTILVDGGYVDVSWSGMVPTYTYRYYLKDHLGSNRVVAAPDGTVIQVNHYDPYGELLPISSSSQPLSYGFSGKEWDSIQSSYDFGARSFVPILPRWTTMDPMSEKYYHLSPYAYCAGNPINLVDPEGKIIVGHTRKDAELFEEDLMCILSDDVFSGFRKLIVRNGKRHRGKQFLKINREDFEAAVSYDFSDDQRAIAEIVFNSINSEEILTVEYVDRGDFISDAAVEAFRDRLEESSINVDLTLAEVGGILYRSTFERIGGGGNTIRTPEGAYSIVAKNSILHPRGRAVTSAHEVFGHGRSLSLGRGESMQHQDAIQLENLVLRVMGIPVQLDGTAHAKGKVLNNANSLPDYR